MENEVLKDGRLRKKYKKINLNVRLQTLKPYLIMRKFIDFGFVVYKETLKFGANQENRAYNHAHLEKIKKQCLNSLDTMPPITINVVTNHIIDGQHRLKAFQMLVENEQIELDSKIKVMFVEIPVEEEKQAIIDANTNSKNWSLDDYIASYAKAGILSYVKLDEWCKAHPLASENGKSKFRYGAAIITGKRCSSDLKNGEFSFTEEEFQRADEVHAEMLEIVELFGLKGKGAWIESLANSWMAVRNQHEFRSWMRELKNKKQRFLKLPKDNSRDWDNIFAQAHLAIDKKK